MVKQEKRIITNPNLILSEVTEFIDTRTNTTYQIDNRTAIGLVPITDMVVKNDNMSKRISFRIPKYFDGINLYEKTIEVGFVNANYENDKTIIDKSRYVVEDSEDLVIYWWLPSIIASEAGRVQFQLRFYDLVQGTNNYAYMWQTKISTFNIEQSLEIGMEAHRNEYFAERVYENTNRSPVNWVTILDYDLPINVNNRTIERVPEDLVISGDTNSQALSFVMPRFKETVDLSKKVITIKYVNALGLSDRARAINLIIDDETIKFTWLINSRFTIESGIGMFSIEILGYNFPIIKPDPIDIREEDLEYFYVWQTKPAKTEIKAGLYIDGAIPLPNPEWEAKWQIESDAKLTKMETLNADALVSKNYAAESAAKAKVSETNAKTSETKAKASEVAAKASETKAKTSETNASSSETKAKASEVAAKTSETNAKASETSALASKNTAVTSATNAKTSETNAKASETAAGLSKTAASASQVAAKTSETNAKTSETSSKTSENRAKSSSDAALASANQAATFVSKAKSWAVGPSGTGDGTDINNAKYYADKAQEAVGNKGWFTNETALLAAHPNNITTPVSRNGWFAILGSTDSIWVWDADRNKWVDSGQGTNDYNALVNKPSVNGKTLTGNVVLTADSIGAFKNNGAIAKGTDLKGLWTPGVYTCYSDDIAATLIDCPTKKAFSLVINQTSGVTQRIVEAPSDGTAKIWYRNITSDGNGTWERLYTTNNKPTPAEIGALTAGDIAAGATKLATARLINGTSFDGTANITTKSWGDSSELIIGSQAKNIDGSLRNYTFNPKDMKLVRFSKNENQDFNGYTENGHYGLIEDKEINGFPSCQNGQIIVSSDSNYIAQIGISTITGKTYVRTKKYLGTWTEWQEILYMTSIINNLTSTSVTNSLSAAQGKILADRTQNLSSTSGITKVAGEIQRSTGAGKFPCSYKGTAFAAPTDWKDGDIFLVYS